MQGDCVVTRLCHDVFRLESCSVDWTPSQSCCNQECLSILWFELSSICSTKLLESYHR
jgi:hypothetical protein